MSPTGQIGQKPATPRQAGRGLTPTAPVSLNKSRGRGAPSSGLTVAAAAPDAVGVGGHVQDGVAPPSVGGGQQVPSPPPSPPHVGAPAPALLPAAAAQAAPTPAQLPVIAVVGGAGVGGVDDAAQNAAAAPAAPVAPPQSAAAAAPASAEVAAAQAAAAPNAQAAAAPAVAGVSQNVGVDGAGGGDPTAAAPAPAAAAADAGAGAPAVAGVSQNVGVDDAGGGDPTAPAAAPLPPPAAAPDAVGVGGHVQGGVAPPPVGGGQQVPSPPPSPPHVGAPALLPAAAAQAAPTPAQLPFIAVVDGAGVGGVDGAAQNAAAAPAKQGFFSRKKATPAAAPITAQPVIAGAGGGGMGGVDDTAQNAAAAPTTTAPAKQGFFSRKKATPAASPQSSATISAAIPPYVHETINYLSIVAEETFQSLDHLEFQKLYATLGQKEDIILIPVGGEAQYLAVYFNGNRAIGKVSGGRFVPETPSSPDMRSAHDRFAEIAKRKIEERVVALTPTLWVGKKNSPITAQNLLSRGGKLTIKRNAENKLATSVVLDLQKSLKLPKLQVKGRIQEYSFVTTIEITQNGDIIFKDRYDVEIPLSGYEQKEVRKIIAEKLNEVTQRGMDKGEAARVASLAESRKGMKMDGAQAMTRSETASSKPVVAGIKVDDSRGVPKSIVAAPKEKTKRFKTLLPKEFKCSRGIASYCITYDDGSCDLFNKKGKVVVTKSDLSSSERLVVENQIELQLQAREAILSIDNGAEKNTIVKKFLEQNLENLVVEKNDEQGFKFKVSKTGSISITREGNIVLKDVKLTSLTTSQADVDVADKWPMSERERKMSTGHAKLTNKIDEVARKIPQLIDQGFLNYKIANCQDEGELLRLFFLTIGAKYLLLARDADSYEYGTSKASSKSEPGKRLKFTFGDDQKAVVKIRLPEEVEPVTADDFILDDDKAEQITVDSTVSLKKLIQIMKDGHQLEKLHDTKHLSEFIKRSEEIDRERKGKKPFTSARERELKSRAIDREYLNELVTGGTHTANSSSEVIVRNTSNSTPSVASIETCIQESDILKHLGKNLFSRMKHADVDYEIKTIGWAINGSKRKVQSYKFHFEAPSIEQGKPWEAFDFTIQAEMSGEITNYELKWNPERKGALQPTFEHVAEAMNRMRGEDDDLIPVRELTQKLKDLEVPTKPTSIIPLPKGFKHNPGFFSKNKSCKFCAILSDGSLSLLDEKGNVVAPNDKIKPAELGVISAQEALRAKIPTTLYVVETKSVTGVARAAPVTKVENHDVLLIALAKKLVERVAVTKVAVTVKSGSKAQMFKFLIPSSEGYVLISQDGVISLKGCTLKKAMSALNLTAEDLLPKERGDAVGASKIGDGGYEVEEGRRTSPLASGFGASGYTDRTGLSTSYGAERGTLPAEEGKGYSRGYDYPSRSPVQPFTASSFTAKASLIEKIVNIAILALPEGKTVKNLLDALRHPDQVNVLLGTEFASTFESSCKRYGVSDKSSVRFSRFSESKAEAVTVDGMNFTQASSRAYSREIEEKLSRLSEINLRELKSIARNSFQTRAASPTQG